MATEPKVTNIQLTSDPKKIAQWLQQAEANISRAINSAKTKYGETHAVVSALQQEELDIKTAIREMIQLKLPL